MNKKTKNILSLFLYTIFFAALFLQFPREGALPENNSTWYGLSLFNFYFNKLNSVFGSHPGFGNFFYPATSVLNWGDTFFLQFPFYFLGRFLGANELNAYYVYLVSAFSLTAFSLYILAFKYLKSSKLAFFSGLVFTCSNFTFGNIGDPPHFFYFFVFLSLFLLKLFFETGKKHYLIYSSILCGLQAHSLAYPYLFLNIVLILYFLINLKRLKSLLNYKKLILIFYIINFTIAGTFFIPYFQKMNTPEFVKPYNNKASATLHSFMNIGEFFKKIPGNLYSPKGDLEENHFIVKYIQDIEILGEGKYIFPIIKNKEIAAHLPPLKKEFLDQKTLYYQIRKSGFVGYLVLLLSIIGLFKLKGKNRLENLGTFFIGIFLCIGPLFYLFGNVYRTPLYWFYEYIPYFDYFRVPSRAYFLSLFSLSIFSAAGIQFILDHIKSKVFQNCLVVGCLIIFLVENIPRPFAKYKYFKPIGDQYFSELKKGRGEVVLYLPSDLGLYFLNDSKDVFPYTREYIYMNWKNYHNHNVLNGVNAYLPKSRLDVQEYIKHLPSKEALFELVNKYKLKYIIYVKEFFDPDLEKDILPGLLKNPYLELIKIKDEVYLFRTKSI